MKTETENEVVELSDREDDMCRFVAVVLMALLVGLLGYGMFMAVDYISDSSPAEVEGYKPVPGDSWTQPAYLVDMRTGEQTEVEVRMFVDENGVLAVDDSEVDYSVSGSSVNKYTNLPIYHLLEN